LRRHIGAKDKDDENNSLMAYITLEDGHGSLELLRSALLDRELVRQENLPVYIRQNLRARSTAAASRTDQSSAFNLDRCPRDVSREDSPLGISDKDDRDGAGGEAHTDDVSGREQCRPLRG
jgi:hypothetical protein